MTSQPLDPGTDQTIVLPLHEEELSVGKRTVTTGQVRVHLTTELQTRTIAEDLQTATATVERVPVGRIVAEHPPVREEDGVTIISVVEEVLVVERRLLLKEEVHVRRVTTQQHHVEMVELRVQNATVERS